MTDPYDRSLDELDRLLNDPDVPFHAGRVWELADEISSRDHTLASLASRPRNLALQRRTFPGV